MLQRVEFRHADDPGIDVLENDPAIWECLIQAAGRRQRGMVRRPRDLAPLSAALPGLLAHVRRSCRGAVGWQFGIEANMDLIGTELCLAISSRFDHRLLVTDLHYSSTAEN
jgi:hypothetical protein